MGDLRRWVVAGSGLIVLVLGMREIRPSSSIFVEQSPNGIGPAVRRAGIAPRGRQAESLRELEALLAVRPDLSSAFGVGADLDLTQILKWAISGPDSGAFRLAPHWPDLREVLFTLENAAPPIPTSAN